MPNGQPDTPLLKTYLWHGDKCFYVSTYERDSSASADYGARYNETLGWSWDLDRNCRSEIVAHTGDGEAFRQHSAVCEQLYRTGEWRDPRDD